MRLLLILRQQRKRPFSEAVVTSIDTLSAFMRVYKLHIPDQLHLVIKLRRLKLLVENFSNGCDAEQDESED